MPDGTSRLIEIPYAPRPLQRSLHNLFDTSRFIVAVCHRRFGKTVMAINQLIKSSITCRLERPRMAYIAPTYRQAKAIAWDYLKHFTLPIPGRTVNEAELRVDLPNGASIQLFGADNPDSLRGAYWDGVCLDEVGLMEQRVWSEVLRPALADRGGFALFIGTPNGKNLFWELRNHAESAHDWTLVTHKASDTHIIPEAELAAMKELMTDDEYAQEMECSFEASVRGAIYAKEIVRARSDGRFGTVPWEPRLPVTTIWDLGVGDSTAIIFTQQSNGELRLFDYYETSGEGLPHFRSVLTERGYGYVRHIAPHDINVRELGSGQSRLEIAASLGIKFDVAPNLPLEDGIQAARTIFPKCWFDQKKCKGLIEALENYRRDWNTRLSEFKATPLHDWASHGADAFRYMAIGMKPDKPKFEPIKYPRSGIM